MNIRFFICALIMYGSAACAMDDVINDPFFKKISRKDQKYILLINKRFKKAVKRNELLIKQVTEARNHYNNSFSFLASSSSAQASKSSRKKLGGYKTPEEMLP